MEIKQCPHLAPITRMRCGLPADHAGSCRVTYRTIADAEAPAGWQTIQWDANLLATLRKGVPVEGRGADDDG